MRWDCAFLVELIPGVLNYVSSQHIRYRKMTNPSSLQARPAAWQSRYANSLSFLRYLLKKWPYYLLCIATFSCLTFFLLRSKPSVGQAFYFNLKSKLSSGGSEGVTVYNTNGYQPLWEVRSALSNEAIFAYVNSTLTIEEAVKRSNFNVRYYTKHYFKQVDLFGRLPYEIRLEGPQGSKYIRFHAEPQGEDGLILSNFMRNNERIPGSTLVPFDQPTATPVGNLLLHRKPLRCMQDAFIGGFEVERTQAFDETKLLDADLTASLYNGVVRVHMESNRATDQVLSMMNEVIAVAAERMLQDATTLLEKTHAQITATLTDEKISLPTSTRNRLEEIRAETELNMGMLPKYDPAQVIDWGTPSKSETDTRLYFAVLMLVLSVFTPTIFFYYQLVLRGRLLSHAEAATILSAASYGKMSRAQNKQQEREWERIAFMLLRHSQEKAEGMTICLCPISPGLDINYIAGQLRASLKRSDIATRYRGSVPSVHTYQPSTESNEFAQVPPNAYIVWLAQIHRDGIDQLERCATTLSNVERTAVIVFD